MSTPEQMAAALAVFEAAYQEARRLETHHWPNTFGRAYKEARANLERLGVIRRKMRVALGLDPNVLS